MAKTTKLVGYGISFDMKLTGGVKTSDDFAYAAKQIEKSINRARNSVKKQELQVELLDQAYRKGAISTKEYEQQKTSLAYKELKRTERLEKERRAVLGLDRQEKLLARNRANRARTAGMAASGVSGLGMGGRAAGAARFLGGAMGLGPSALSLGAGFAGLSFAKESISAFAKLQSQVEGMKSLFGEDIALRLSDQFRELSKNTILTNSQLIENARTWASYGLTTEGLTDRLKRLGTVAGGNSEKFRALTIAFAQVNAQGKLMGQEKNQLINAGMSLQAVADAAGISMENFADAMSNGEISAEHLNQALVNITSEGGMFAGYLEKQAETINGKLTILSATWEEFLVKLGTSEEVAAGVAIDKLTELLKELKGLTEWWMGERDLVNDKTFRERTLQQTTSRAPVMGGMSGGLMPSPYAKSGEEYEASRKAMEEHRKRMKQEEEAAAVQKEVSEELAKNFELQMALVRASEGMQGHLMSDVRTRQERTGTQDIGRRERFLIHEQARQIEQVYGKEARSTFEAIYPSIFDDEFAKSFVGPMKATAVEQANLREAEKREEDRLAAQKNKDEIEFQALRKQLIQEDQREAVEAFRQREKDIAKQLQEERQLAQTPSVSGFQAGSTGEFEFLRQQRQKGETARAVERANEKAEKQREALANEKKQADLETQRLLRSIDGKIQDLNEKQNQFI